MLVVRVKRRRDDEPVDTICIVEDNSRIKRKKNVASLTNVMQNLSTEKHNIEAQVVLSRVKTTENLEYTSKDIEVNSQQGKLNPRKPNLVVVNKNKSHITSGDVETDCIVVDMMQIEDETQGPQSKAVGNVILDPPTRLLERGIRQATERNDFNDLSNALMQGANANHQCSIQQGGMTALMAAASKCNVRMVNRLLMKDVSTLAKNSEGKTAYDLVKPTARTAAEGSEIKRLLEIAMNKVAMKLSQEYKVDSAQIAQHRANFANPGDSGSYVYDFYHVRKGASQAAEANGLGEEKGGAVPVVRVDGLRFSSVNSDLTAELVFDYDSDWSDLGDDEDPDSNDERFEGNDYPDEPEEEEDEADWREEGEDGVEEGFYMTGRNRRATQRKGRAVDNDSDEEDAADRSFARDLRQRTARLVALGNALDAKRKKLASAEGRGGGRAVGYAMDDEDEDEDDEADVGDADDDDAEDEDDLLAQDLPLDPHSTFDRQLSVGKVLRPHYLGSNDPEALNKHTSESLRALWQEDVPAPENDAYETSQRLAHMRERTGMLFASNLREFDSTGLPKYGAELSDEDEAMHRMYVDDDEEERPEAATSHCSNQIFWVS